MARKRSKLAIAGDVGSVVSALAALWVIGPSVPARLAQLGGAITISAWHVYLLGGSLLLSLFANVLFSIASRKQAKSVAIETALGFHSGKVDGGEAALFWHYSACSNNLARRLEDMWQHWYQAGEVLSRPLDRNLPIKNQLGGPSRELDIFTIIYGENLNWLKWEIPEFSVTLPPLGSGVEYLTLLNDLKNHARLLDEAAKRICESQPAEKRDVNEESATRPNARAIPRSA